MKKKWVQMCAFSLVMASTSGCATVLAGSSQEILVTTTPAGAKCDLMRGDVSIGSVDSTPGYVTVKKTKDDMKIVCNKDGYLPTTHQMHSGTEPSAFTNIFLGGLGLITWGVDSIGGSDNHYPDSPSITLANQSSSKKG